MEIQNNRSPQLSIVVPIYNAAAVLERCIRSILNQSFADFELILVNDGSKDNSLEICKRFATNDQRIVIIDKTNGGAGSARNAGLAVAKGEYIAFPDADDWLEPSMYQELMDAAHNKHSDLVICGMYFWNEHALNDPKARRESKPDSVSFTSENECRANVMTFLPDSYTFGVPWNKLYRLETIRQNDITFCDLKRNQDAVFNLDFYHCIKSLVTVPQPLYNYVIPAEEEKKYPKNFIDIKIIYYSRLIQKLRAWGVYTQEVKQYYDNRFFRHYWNAMGLCFQREWNLSREEKKMYIAGIFNKPEIQMFISDAQLEERYKKKSAVIRKKDVDSYFGIVRREKFANKVERMRYFPNRLVMRILGEKKYHSLKKWSRRPDSKMETINRLF